MKKFIRISFALCAFLFVFGLVACGATEKETTEYKGTMAELTDTEASVFKYQNCDADGLVTKDGEFVTITGLNDNYPLGIKIPSTINGKSVLAINTLAFQKTDVVLLSVPATVEVIGEYALSGSKIKEIEFQASSKLSDVEKYAFSGTELVNIVLPASLDKLGAYAFSGCHSLKTVTFDDSFEKIPDYCFNSCSSLETVTMNGVKSLGIGAFQNSGISAITIPEAVTVVKKNTFFNCIKLTTVTLSSATTAVGSDAFKGCAKLESVELPSTLTDLGKGSFALCKGLKTVVINGTITTNYGANDEAPFEGCTGVQSFTFKASEKITELVLFGVSSADDLPANITIVK